jgi:hypothetical protein
MSHSPQDISPTCNRRQFWRAMLHEAFVISEALKGKPPYQLSELGQLPDEQLAQIKPIVNSNHKIFIDQGYVYSQSKKSETTFKLFPMAKENLVVFNMFNGENSLGEVGRQVSQEMDWDEARGFAHARGLFLDLVRRLVCLPQNPLEFDE